MNIPSIPRSFAALFCAIAATVGSLQAQISLTDSGYTQDFNQTASFPTNTAGFYTWADNSSIPGWYSATVNSTNDPYYRASNANGVTPTSGGSNPGAVSVLALRRSGTEAALGTVSSSDYYGIIGARFVNDTGSTIASLTLNYRGEQWAWNTGGSNTLEFAYSLDASTLFNGNWTTENNLSFTALYSGNSASQALDGNGDTIFVSNSYVAKDVGQAGGPGALNHTTIAYTITGLSIAPGETFWIRWTDNWVGTGGQIGQALGIDDFSINATPIPEPGALALALGMAALAITCYRRRVSRSH